MGRASLTGQRQSDGDFSAHAITRHAPRNETLMRRGIQQAALLNLMTCSAISATAK